MQLIQHQELGSAQASITFSSIPQTYTDLYLVFSTRLSTTNGGLRLKVNTSTANLSTRLLYGNGSSATSASDTTYLGTSSNSNHTASTFGSGTLYITNYAGSTTKSFSADIVDENNGTGATQWITAGLYNSTTAITSLELFGDAAGNFTQYSSATLYGILKGSDGVTTVS
jgi:hypothetical protein